MQSIKVEPSQPTVLKASPAVAGPSEANCLMQIAHIHRLKDSEENNDKHRLDLSIRICSNREGLSAPLKLTKLHREQKCLKAFSGL